MMNKIKRSTVTISSILLILLLLGVFFRFVNLDRQLYWVDEIITSLRISGHTWSEVNQQLVGSDRIISIEDLQKYQYPNLEKGAIDTIKSLALDEPKHVPLYYVSARFWVQWFGNSVAVMRSFSAFISLLAFPCLYWLCQELFESPIVGWVAVTLIAVSPVHVIFAQEARPYSLWIVTILLSSATLLRAIRVQTKISWGIYAATVTLGLYTQLFFLFVAIGHGIYVAAIERFRLTRTSISCLLALLAGLFTFVPWLLILMIIKEPNPETAGWTNTKQTFLDSAIRWSGIISRTFFDLSATPSDSLKLKIALVPLILTLLALIIYSIYFLCRRTSKQVWLFVLTLIGSVGLPLMLLDFILGKRYGTTRYILPSSLGIQLSIAYLFATKITPVSANIRRQKLWQFIAFILISSGVLSCAIRSPAEIWWNKLPNEFGHYPQIARIINQANEPLLLSYDGFRTQILGHLLEQKVRLQLLNESDIPEISDDFGDVFLLDSYESSGAELGRAYNSEFKQIYSSLWRLENQDKKRQ